MSRWHLWPQRILHNPMWFLDWEGGLQTVIHILVTSQFNYSNIVYIGLPLKTTQNLQFVQNAEVWIVTSLLLDLHWLPVSISVQFKVLVITSKPYLANLTGLHVLGSFDETMAFNGL